MGWVANALKSWKVGRGQKRLKTPGLVPLLIPSYVYKLNIRMSEKVSPKNWTYS